MATGQPVRAIPVGASLKPFIERGGVLYTPPLMLPEMGLTAEAIFVTPITNFALADISYGQPIRHARPCL